MNATSKTIVIIFTAFYVMIVIWIIVSKLNERKKKVRYEKDMSRLRAKIKTLRVNYDNAATIAYLFHEIKRGYDIDPVVTDRLYDEFLARFKPVLHARIKEGI